MTSPASAFPAVPWTPAEVDAWAAILIATLPKWEPDRRHPYCADDADLIMAIAWGCFMAANRGQSFDQVRALCEMLFASGVEAGRNWPTVNLDP